MEHFHATLLTLGCLLSALGAKDNQPFGISGPKIRRLTCGPIVQVFTLNPRVSAPSELGVSCRVKVPFDKLTATSPATSTRGGRTGLGDPGGSWTTEVSGASAQGKWMVCHRRRNPETEVGRTLNGDEQTHTNGVPGRQS